MRNQRSVAPRGSYYFGFFLAAALNYMVGARIGWRAMFLCGLSPVLVSLLITMRVKEPRRWKKHADRAERRPSEGGILGPKYRKRTIVNTALLTVAIVGLWAGSVYEPTAIIALAKKTGLSTVQAAKATSFGTVILSIGTILGCLMAPVLAERVGGKKALAIYFSGMFVFIVVTFGWIFYISDALRPFIACLFFLGFFGGNFALFSLWLPEQYDTSVRATACSFATSFGRFVGAGVNFLIGALVRHVGTIGKPVACTAISFVVGMLIIPFATKTHKEFLPE